MGSFTHLNGALRELELFVYIIFHEKKAYHIHLSSLDPPRVPQELTFFPVLTFFTSSCKYSHHTIAFNFYRSPFKSSTEIILL